MPEDRLGTALDFLMGSEGGRTALNSVIGPRISAMATNPELPEAGRERARGLGSPESQLARIAGPFDLDPRVLGAASGGQAELGGIAAPGEPSIEELMEAAAIDPRLQNELAGVLGRGAPNPEAEPGMLQGLAEKLGLYGKGLGAEPTGQNVLFDVNQRR